mgnify:CR=1 FL=1
MIIWHEALFHAGGKSRTALEDMRLFGYVWAEDDDGTLTQRTRGTTDGIAREQGDQIYRNNITNKICKDIIKFVFATVVLYIAKT